MPAIKEFAGQAAARAAEIQHETDATYTFDPATIMVIIEMIMKFIEMFQDCKKPVDAAVESARSPNRIEQFVFKLQSNRMLRKAGYSRPARKSIRAGVMETAQGIDAAQMAQMYEEV